MHFPESRLPTHLASKPCCSKMSVYHGLRAAERKKTRPSTLSTLFKATICSSAAPSVSLGSNQSIESMSCRVDIRTGWANEKIGTYDCNSQSRWTDTCHHFHDFIRVDSQSIERIRLRELSVGFGAEVSRVASVKKSSSEWELIEHISKTYFLENLPCRHR